MTTRSSKRLKVAAECAVTVATETTTPVKKIKKSRTATTKPTTKARATSTALASVEGEEEINEPETVTKTTKNKSSKDAWNALFIKPSITSKSGCIQIKPVKNCLSKELQSKIDAFPLFSDIPTTPSTSNTFKIIAWNVNGLRAVLKHSDSVHFHAYIAQENPDVVCLSETKIGSEELQSLDTILPQYEYQYWSCATKKGYAGTAILSKTKPLSVKDELLISSETNDLQEKDEEGRFLALEYTSFWLVHTYVPNAGMKLDRLSYRTTQWDPSLRQQLIELETTSKKPVVWCGDLNVAHQEMDIHDPKSNRNKSPGFTDIERECFSKVLESGFIDTYRYLHPETIQYTYWSYRFNCRSKNKGWRLDYFVVSESLLTQLKSSFVRDKIIGSDHVPIGVEIQV